MDILSGRGNESCPWDSPGSAERLCSERVSDNNPDKIPDNTNCEDNSKGQQHLEILARIRSDVELFIVRVCFTSERDFATKSLNEVVSN